MMRSKLGTGKALHSNRLDDAVFALTTALASKALHMPRDDDDDDGGANEDDDRDDPDDGGHHGRRRRRR